MNANEEFNISIGRQLKQHENTKVMFVECMDDVVIIEEHHSTAIEFTVLIRDIEQYCIEWIKDKIDVDDEESFLEWMDLLPSKELAKIAQMSFWYAHYRDKYYENEALAEANHRAISYTPIQAPREFLAYSGYPRE